MNNLEEKDNIQELVLLIKLWVRQTKIINYNKQLIMKIKLKRQKYLTKKMNRKRVNLNGRK